MNSQSRGTGAKRVVNLKGTRGGVEVPLGGGLKIAKSRSKKGNRAVGGGGEPEKLRLENERGKGFRIRKTQNWGRVSI